MTRHWREFIFGWRDASPPPDFSEEAKEIMMAVSAQFQTALDNLVAAFEAKQAAAVQAVQTELDAANATIAAGGSSTADADDTAAVIAATPAP